LLDVPFQVKEGGKGGGGNLITNARKTREKREEVPGRGLGEKKGPEGERPARRLIRTGGEKGGALLKRRSPFGRKKNHFEKKAVSESAIRRGGQPRLALAQDKRGKRWAPCSSKKNESLDASIT